MSKNFKKVVWSPTGLKTRGLITEQIISRWTLDVALRFDTEVEKLVERIQENNSICPKSNFLNIHKCTLSFQTSLIYQILGDEIEIIALVDNRPDHSF